LTSISFRHRTFINLLKLIGGRKILAKQFESGRGVTAAPTAKQRKKYNIEHTEFRGQPIWTYPGENTLIYYIHGGGDKDLLHPDIMSAVEKMRGQGLTPSLDVAEGLAHVYMLLPTPEGKAGLSRIARATQFS